jgi:hypothetical protein
MVLLTLTLPFKIFQALKVMFGFQQLTQVPGKALRRRPESIAVLISSSQRAHI